MSPAPGEAAPDFELLDQHGTPTRLSSFRGRSVLLVFFPWAFSGICSGELRTLSDDLGFFQNDDVALLAVSVDSTFAQRVFSDSEGFEFPILSDSWPHGWVAQRYGVLDDRTGVALRGTFLIDRGGVVRWSQVRPLAVARDADDYRRALWVLQR